jgi:hypothetical protein
MDSILFPILAFVVGLAILYVRDQPRRRTAAVGSSPGGETLRSYIGGMRWEPRMNATFPFARLAVSTGGITAGPSARFVPLVPTLMFRWEELNGVEPVGWFVPFIADGVRFRSGESCFIFWTGSSWRTKRLLDLCEANSGRPVSRRRQRAPLNGCD